MFTLTHHHLPFPWCCVRLSISYVRCSGCCFPDVFPFSLRSNANERERAVQVTCRGIIRINELERKNSCFKAFRTILCLLPPLFIIPPAVKATLTNHCWCRVVLCECTVTVHLLSSEEYGKQTNTCKTKKK